MPESYSIRDMALDQAKALKLLGITKTDVMGVSQGGMIAQFLAIDYPELVEKLIITASASRVNEMTYSVVSSCYHRFFVNANAILGFDAYKELNKIVCPTYIIGGDEDKTVGVHASYEMKEKIKHSEMYIYKGLGHAVYEEARDFYSRVYKFLSE